MRSFLSVIIAVFFFGKLDAQFITIWNSDVTGVTNNTASQIHFPGIGTNYSLSWKELSNPSNNGFATGNGITLVSFPSPGIYEVTATAGSGTLTGFVTHNAYTSLVNAPWELIGVKQWGSNHWIHTSNYGASNLCFSNAINMNVTATDVPDLSGLTRLDFMFNNCQSLTGNSSFNNWDVTGKGLLTGMFQDCRIFNAPVGNWDVSQVWGMARMFSGAKIFNQDITQWDTRNLQQMFGMFSNTDNFNQPIGNWNVGNVTNLSRAFRFAIAFNQPLNNWNTSKVQSMGEAFYCAWSFNQPLNHWNLSALSYGSFALIPDPAIDIFHRTSMSCENYSKTLIGWANAPNTPNNIVIGDLSNASQNDFLKYGPLAQSAHNALAGNGWTFANDLYDAGCNFVLPVSFGEITASLKSKQLLVNWQTLKETNNEYFEVQLSNDGKAFTTIAHIDSQVASGNSDVLLNYDYKTDITTKTPMLGVIAIGFLLIAFKRRHGGQLFIALPVLIFTVFLSCNRDNDSISPGEPDNLYVRIKQVDKDGEQSYSKIVRVIKE